MDAKQAPRQIKYGQLTGQASAGEGNTRIPFVFIGKLHGNGSNLIHLALNDIDLAIAVFRALRRWLLRRGEPCRYCASQKGDVWLPGTLLSDRRTVLLDTGELVTVSAGAMVTMTGAP